MQISQTAAGQALVPCPENVDKFSENGLLTITVPSIKPKDLRIRYGSFEKEAEYDSAINGARLSVILNGSPDPVELLYGDGSSCKIDIAGKYQPAAFRITVAWTAPVYLRLHVIEPRGQMLGTLGGKGHAVWEQSPRLSKGFIDLNDDGHASPPFQATYSLPPNESWLEGDFKVCIENVTRTRIPSGEFCGAGKYTHIPVSITVLDHGLMYEHPRVFLPDFPCNVPLTEDESCTKVPYKK